MRTGRSAATPRPRPGASPQTRGHQHCDSERELLSRAGLWLSQRHRHGGPSHLGDMSQTAAAPPWEPVVERGRSPHPPRPPRPPRPPCPQTVAGVRAALRVRGVPHGAAVCARESGSGSLPARSAVCAVTTRPWWSMPSRSAVPHYLGDTDNHAKATLLLKPLGIRTVTAGRTVGLCVGLGPRPSVLCPSRPDGLGSLLLKTRHWLSRVFPEAALTRDRPRQLGVRGGCDSG